MTLRPDDRMRILIVGGSIAGLAAALELGRAGHDVVVLERADGRRSGGIAIDVRGAALETAKRMGIFDEIHAARIEANAVWDFLDRDGAVEHSVHLATEFYDSPDDLELLRDRLVEIIAAHVPDSVEFRYGENVTGLEQATDSVLVEVDGSYTERFDLVVGADGTHSTTRRLAFGPEHEFVHHLDTYVGLIKDCPSISDVTGTQVYRVPGRGVTVGSAGAYPVALLAFRSPWLDYDYRDELAQKGLLVEAFADVQGWRVPALVRDVPSATDFYFDSVAQVRMDSWVSGRVVLVGDSGYAPAFFSGMGSSLAMIGAECLATELANRATVEEALAAYGTAMRPHVQAAHAVAMTGVETMFPDEFAAEVGG